MAERVYTHTTKGCFGCGEDNTYGLGLRPYKDEAGLMAEFVAQPHHQGFARVAHGGIVAAVLDEIVTTAVAVASESLVATRSLDIRYFSPLRLGRRHVVRGRLAKGDAALLEGEGEIVDEETGARNASARGTFVILTPERAARFRELKDETEDKR